MTRPEVIQQIKETLQRVAPTAKAIVYGSEARGDARQDSDIDLLILMDGDKLTLQKEEEITLPLYELELKTGIPISPIVMLKTLWAMLMAGDISVDFCNHSLPKKSLKIPGNQFWFLLVGIIVIPPFD